ncbi:MAG: class I SAM-dependent methyltransferase [Pyrinomonadaceae bacterium]
MEVEETRSLVDVSEEALAMPRAKHVSLTTKLAYRLTDLCKKLFGRQRTLRFFLRGSRLFWRFAFEISGEIYDSRFHNHAKALSEDILKRHILANGSVIDVGCGVGRWCRIASKYADKVVGIDYSQSLIDEARRRTQKENVTFLVGDVTTDLKNEKFDLALLLHVIEHLDDADRILQELKSVASKIIVEVPDFEQDSLNYVRLEQNLAFYSDGDHVREYTLDILQQQLERNDWRVVETFKNGGAVLAVAD